MTGAKIGTGGSIERDLVRRYVRRQKKLAAMRVVGGEAFQRGVSYFADVIIAWLDAQPARLRRRGGLGRK